MNYGKGGVVLVAALFVFLMQINLCWSRNTRSKQWIDSSEKLVTVTNLVPPQVSVGAVLSKFPQKFAASSFESPSEEHILASRQEISDA